jgi:hypothetical protein
MKRIVGQPAFGQLRQWRVWFGFYGAEADADDGAELLVSAWAEIVRCARCWAVLVCNGSKLLAEELLAMQAWPVALIVVSCVCASLATLLCSGASRRLQKHSVLLYGSEAPCTA